MEALKQELQVLVELEGVEMAELEPVVQRLEPMDLEEGVQEVGLFLPRMATQAAAVRER